MKTMFPSELIRVLGSEEGRKHPFSLSEDPVCRPVSLPRHSFSMTNSLDPKVIAEAFKMA
jgi:hypothetical protein